ncbi:MAG TPA: hypothetical protein VEJ16_07235 [Alphaproteobacteria bacterium]|nr:hypothetical protein [Alphaproteobacteria bacterium]
MAKTAKPQGPRDRGAGKRRPDRDHDRKHGDEPGRSDPLGRDYPVFSKLRGARWQGSAPATAQAFARAVSQWRRLPGAVGTTATDLGKGATEPPPATGGGEKGDVP